LGFTLPKNTGFAVCPHCLLETKLVEYKHTTLHVVNVDSLFGAKAACGEHNTKRHLLLIVCSASKKSAISVKLETHARLKINEFKFDWASGRISHQRSCTDKRLIPSANRMRTLIGLRLHQSEAKQNSQSNDHMQKQIAMPCARPAWQPEPTGSRWCLASMMSHMRLQVQGSLCAIGDASADDHIGEAIAISGSSTFRSFEEM